MDKDCCQSNSANHKNNKKNVLILGIGVVIVLAFVLILVKPTKVSYVSLDSYQEEVPLYKSFSCGCCDVHANYLESRGGLDIKISEEMDISYIKSRYGVPSELESCHTAIMGDYFVEGHMPLEAIDKLLTEKPDIRGIALPGMPSGSPGMPGPKNSEWIIYAVNHDGTYNEFMRL